MSTFELPQPDATWSESAISAYQALGVFVQTQIELLHKQSELLQRQSELLLKQEATIQALQERLNLNIPKVWTRWMNISQVIGLG